MKKQQAVLLALVLVGAVSGVTASQVRAESITQNDSAEDREASQPEHSQEIIVESWMEKESQQNRDAKIQIENKEQIRDLLTEMQLNHLQDQLLIFLQDNSIVSRLITIPRDQIVQHDNGNFVILCHYAAEGQTIPLGIQGEYLQHNNTYQFTLI